MKKPWVFVRVQYMKSLNPKPSKPEAYCFGIRGPAFFNQVPILAVTLSDIYRLLPARCG